MAGSQRLSVDEMVSVQGTDGMTPLDFGMLPLLHAAHVVPFAAGRPRSAIERTRPETEEKIMTTLLNLDTSANHLRKISDDLNAKGVVCIENAVPPETLERWRAQLQEYLARQGHRYFSIIQPWKDANWAYASLAQDEGFRTLLTGLTTLGDPGNKGDGDIYNVLRVVAGPNGADHSLQFHYDASVITALIPLEIPEGRPEESGDLIAYPNMRPIRKIAAFNVLEKLMVQNPISRHLQAVKIRNRKDDSNIVKLRPGNIYLFWGYRTLHANLGCKSNSLRATLLFHHGDPHDGSIATRAIKWVRRVREQSNLRPGNA
jgi:hypothetical protein